MAGWMTLNPLSVPRPNSAWQYSASRFQVSIAASVFKELLILTGGVQVLQYEQHLHASLVTQQFRVASLHGECCAYYRHSSGWSTKKTWVLLRPTQGLRRGRGWGFSPYPHPHPPPEREDEWWKLPLNSSFCKITAGSQPRWPQGRKAYVRGGPRTLAFCLQILPIASTTITTSWRG